MTDKTCKKCKKSGLGWDKKFHDLTGKWKLESHRRVDGKWCNKPPEKMFSKARCILCKLCNDSSFGLCRSPEDLEIHKRAYHKFNERLTDLDYKMMHSNLSQSTLLNWKSDPHFHLHYKNSED
ncbi:MAG: hypothetical protein H8D92_01990 [Pelagibacteraceae bacterium]|jgi:hypothetical protein|nr:hypothetical protein [Pelagibacteraceae bacterium]